MTLFDMCIILFALSGATWEIKRRIDQLEVRK